MNDTFPINIENFLKVIIMAVWTAIMFYTDILPG